MAAAKDSRKFHEDFALWGLAETRRWLPAAHSMNCGHALESAVKAARHLAAARAHLASLGTKPGPRTRKLWGVVSRREKDVRAALDHLLRGCLARTAR